VNGIIFEAKIEINSQNSQFIQVLFFLISYSMGIESNKLMTRIEEKGGTMKDLTQRQDAVNIDSKAYIQATELLDFNTSSIQALIEKRKWKTLPEKERICQIYDYVRDEILFGYNEKDELTASEILQDGIGQCNTKSTLLMALLRAAGIPCRLHGFTIDKALQKGAFTGIWYKVAPKNILHTWVEISYQGTWYNLEGVILDQAYLLKLQQKFKKQRKNFCGYGVFTEDLMTPQITWNESDTYIQKLGINQDFGLFDSPDELYKKHQQELSFVKLFIFKNFIRQSNNKNVSQIRNMELTS